jgi:hypothetical protein
VNGTTVNATTETGEPIHIPGTSTSNTVWWRYTPPANTTLRFDTIGSDVDTAMAVYAGGAVNALTQVAANNDIGAGNVLSRVIFNATGGVSYAIAVSGIEGQQDTITLNLAVVAPTNDNFANRIAIAAPGTVSGNNVLATAQTGEPNHAGNATARTSVWWSFRPTVTGPLTVQTFGSNFNTVLGVYTGSAVNALTQVASNDDGGGGVVQSRVTFNAVAGTSYAFAVAGGCQRHRQHHSHGEWRRACQRQLRQPHRHADNPIDGYRDQRLRHGRGRRAQPRLGLGARAQRLVESHSGRYAAGRHRHARQRPRHDRRGLHRHRSQCADPGCLQRRHRRRDRAVVCEFVPTFGTQYQIAVSGKAGAVGRRQSLASSVQRQFRSAEINATWQRVQLHQRQCDSRARRAHTCRRRQRPQQHLVSVHPRKNRARDANNL